MFRSLMRRKKNDDLVPVIRYDDGSLFIDCGECPGTSSPGDAECVRCISSEIYRNGPVSRLLMRKDNDVEHSEDVISVMNGISQIASLLHTASSEKVSSRCRTCACSIPKNAKDLWDSFPEPRFDIMRLEVERSDPMKEGCEECVWRTIGFIDRIETMTAEIRKRAAKTAFRLAEV